MKNFVIIALVVVIAVVGFVYWKNRRKSTPAQTGPANASFAPENEPATNIDRGGTAVNQKLQQTWARQGGAAVGGGKVSDLSNGTDVDKGIKTPTSQEVYIANQDGSLGTVSYAPSTVSGTTSEPTRSQLESTPTLSGTTSPAPSDGTGSR